MPPKPNFSNQDSNRQTGQQQWNQSQGSGSQTNVNEKAVINLPKSEPSPVIVQSLIKFFKEE